ncbi:hypothetical protein CYMTET_32311, partial [Cymbomonas tetramitiformis]
MLVRNDEMNLQKILPVWKTLIDSWVVGILDSTTDESAAVVQLELDGIPGDMTFVHVTDNLGVVWSQLMQLAFAKFPHSTHGVLVHADYLPINVPDNPLLAPSSLVLDGEELSTSLDDPHFNAPLLDKSKLVCPPPCFTPSMMPA